MDLLYNNNNHTQPISQVHTDFIYITFLNYKPHFTSSLTLLVYHGHLNSFLEISTFSYAGQ